jgi:RimJ/RimL family protein N-acetyltransferase
LALRLKGFCAEQRSLEKAGFTREGVLRGFEYRLGRRYDLATYGKLRGEDGLPLRTRAE